LVTRTTALTAVTFGISTFSALSPAFAQDAKAIIAKSIAAYSNLKTYQADLTMEQTGPQGKSKTTIALKKSGEKMFSKITTSAPTQMGKNITSVTDGKTITLYMGDMKQYMKMPVSPMTKQMMNDAIMPNSIMKKVAQEGTVKKLADGNMNGKPTFVLESSDSKQPNSPKTRLYIDKATSRLVKIEGTAPAANPMGGGSMTLLFRNEKINAAIPASAFVFTPPKGAKAMANPMGGGGAPGGGR